LVFPKYIIQRKLLLSFWKEERRNIANNF